MNAGIILAAGKSERMGTNMDKAFLTLGPKPVLAYSMMAFEACEDIDTVVVVARKDKVAAVRGMAQMFGCAKVSGVVTGGSKRQASVASGLEALDDDVTMVAIHDAARPCVKPELISATIKAAKRYGSGVAAMRIVDTVKYVERGMKVTRTEDRSKLWAVQTPQTFKVDLLRKAIEHVENEGETVTDDAAAVESLGKDVHLVPSDLSNVKITTTDDLPLVAALLNATT